jgi:imidazole glycerol-phosphate synthase subunit HisH
VSDLVVVPTGTANMASVRAAFNRLGTDVVEATTPDGVSTAAGVVLPGVGAFGAAMSQVDALGMRQALRDRVDQGSPTLAVCVGMQLLCGSSEESPGVEGLGVLGRTVSRFGGEQKVPQLGWNRVEPGPGSRFVEPGWAYFANSFRMDEVPEGWVGSGTNYGGVFVSALERGDVLACQFHPELSGSWGAGLLGRWLETTGVAA